MNRYVCSICGYLYDEAAGILTSGIAPGTPWPQLPDSWVCPRCGAAVFRRVAPQKQQAVPVPRTAMEKSALCSGLARGCEKQYLPEAAALFTQLASYFAKAAPVAENASLAGLLESAEADLAEAFPAVKTTAEADGDRGAQRALVWSEKVTRIQRSLLARHAKQGDKMLEGRDVFVCSICGFIAVRDAPPALCPVCKAPDWKFEKVKGR